MLTIRTDELDDDAPLTICAFLVKILKRLALKIEADEKKAVRE